MMILELAHSRPSPEQQQEVTRRRRLFTLAHGPDPTLAKLALRILRNRYHLRKPLIEEKLGLAWPSLEREA